MPPPLSHVSPLQVSRIRGQLGRVDTPVIVSFDTKEECLKCLQDPGLTSKVEKTSV